MSSNGSNAGLFCFFFQEASWLSSLLPELKERGVSLYGIVHEEKGANSFNEYLKGEMLYDKEVSSGSSSSSNSKWQHIFVLFLYRKCSMVQHSPEAFLVSLY